MTKIKAITELKEAFEIAEKLQKVAKALNLGDIKVNVLVELPDGRSVEMDSDDNYICTVGKFNRDVQGRCFIEPIAEERLDGEWRKP